tara:strand:- start:23363 stop:23605 length:243 start_codon:yes stop_codon:yes gene_type:complete
MQNASGWQVSKVINLGDMLTIIIMGISLFLAYNSIDKRIDSNAQRIEFLKEQRDEDVRRVEKRLDSIDKKLDQLLQTRAN